MRKFVLFAATGGGSGYAPVAPGTAGSLVGVGVWLLAVRGGAAAQLGVLLALVALGIWVAGQAETLFGAPDDGRITIDEVAGQLVALLWLPLRLDVVLVGFLLFRLLDIWKPWPARAAERLAGGLGVVADDLVAGAYTNLAGQLLWRLALPGGLL